MKRHLTDITGGLKFFREHEVMPEMFRRKSVPKADHGERTEISILFYVEGTRPKRPCNTSDDFKAYNDLISSLESNKLAVTKERTGCLNKCNYTRFRVTPYTESVDPYAVKENVTHAIFGLPDPYVRVESEQPNYDANSFIGDVGGFLGLLLGLSILDIYELCKSAGTRIFRGGLREGHTPRKLAPKS